MISRVAMSLPLLGVVGYLFMQFGPEEVPWNRIEGKAPVSVTAAIGQDRPVIHHAHIAWGAPSSDCEILERTGYIACHDPQTKVADWVSYHLKPDYLSGEFSRTDDFRPDPDLAQGERSELVDYKGSGFDRGHLCPAADMSRTELTMRESFLLSNMAPQTPRLNRGPWKMLEAKVRNWAKEREKLHVITGPLYLDLDNDGNPENQTIGPNAVSIPTHFYKIIVSENLQTGLPDATAFVMENSDQPTKILTECLKSIDEIEAMSGLDFLSELEDSLENQLEAQTPVMW